MELYDVAIIGAGPGGYVAAIRAAQIGKKVVVVEQGPVGGTCLNVGCIPSKTFLRHAEWALTMRHANEAGLENQLGKVDIRKLVARKVAVVDTLRGGIRHLFQKYKITLVQGRAQFNARNELEVDGKTIKANKTLLATGSVPFVPPIPGLSDLSFDTTDSFFDLESLPSRLVIIGGGVIGVELAFAMAPLGVETCILEVAGDILLSEDPEARQVIKKELKRLGIEVLAGINIQSVAKDHVQLADRQVPFDRLLVATGRVADLALARQLGLKLDERSRFVQVDSSYQTSKAGVYAIGDLIGGLMLAHTASAEGLAAVDSIFGQPGAPVDPNRIPRCVYSFPEIASVGLSEEEARRQGRDVVVKKQPFSGNGRAISAGETAGFVKLITDRKYGEVLGAVIVGAQATEMIHTVLATMQSEGTVQDLSEQIFAHPTLSEVIGETAKSVIFKAIHE